MEINTTATLTQNMNILNLKLLGEEASDVNYLAYNIYTKNGLLTETYGLKLMTIQTLLGI